MNNPQASASLQGVRLREFAAGKGKAVSDYAFAADSPVVFSSNWSNFSESREIFCAQIGAGGDFAAEKRHAANLQL